MAAPSPLYPAIEKSAPEPELVAPVTLDAATADAAVREAVLGSVLRPADIRHAEIAPPALAYVPFFRITVEVSGFHLGIALSSTPEGRSMPIPTGGARRVAGTVMICARTIVPYVTKVPSALGRIAPVRPLEVERHELVAADTIATSLQGEERVGADVTREAAERAAVALFLRQVEPASALYAKYEHRIDAVAYLYYPLYVAPYRYRGEARRYAGEEFFVMVSGRTGHVVAAKHPSVLRAVTAKLRRWVTPDFEE